MAAVRNFHVVLKLLATNNGPLELEILNITYRLHANIVYKSIITNIATARIFGVISNKFTERVRKYGRMCFPKGKYC
jgi:hypothetical protein